MKSIFLVICCMLISYSSFCQATLTITVTDIRNTKGSIAVGLYTSKESFLKKTSIGKAVKASGTEVKVVFENLRAGEYAISIIHDENNNKDLDRNRLGLPKEGYGFGNNAKSRFGPPKYDEVKILIKDQPVSQTVEMKYL